MLSACGADSSADANALGTLEQALTGSKLATTLLAAPGWSQATRLLDGSTSTKSTSTARTAYLELQLDGEYTLTKVRVAEDNAGSQHVDAFGIQCWNGGGYGDELFRETNTPIAVPGFNEHEITGTSCTTNRVKVNLYNNAALEAFEVEIYGAQPAPPPPAGTFYVDVSTGPGGRVYPTSETDPWTLLEVDEGGSIGFHFMPDPGYRVSAICTPDYDQCFSHHYLDYTLQDTTGEDRVFYVLFEELSAGTVQVPVTVRGSTLANAAAVVDGNVTTTKSTGPSYSYVDLEFDGYYEVSGLQVFEDNGAWEIDQYGIQCWDGFSWRPELFRAVSDNRVKPTPNEYHSSDPTCLANRVRVNLYNNGTVEAFEVKVFGIARNAFATPEQGPLALGSHRSDNGHGPWVFTEAFLVHQDPYVESLSNSTPPWQDWVYVEGASFNAFGELRGSGVSLDGVYVRHCQTGEWTPVGDTSYAPVGPSFNVTDDEYTLFFHDIPDVEDGFPDPEYDCPVSPRNNSSVWYNGQVTPIMREGEVTFAYVVTHH
jgi:hypothetical protein